MVELGRKQVSQHPDGMNPCVLEEAWRAVSRNYYTSMQGLRALQ